MDSPISNFTNIENSEESLRHKLPKPPSQQLILFGSLVNQGTIDWLPTAIGRLVYSISPHVNSSTTALLCTGYARNSFLSLQHARSYAENFLDQVEHEKEPILLAEINSNMNRIDFMANGDCTFVYYNGGEHRLVIDRLQGAVAQHKHELDARDVVIVALGMISGDIETKLHEHIAAGRAGDSSFAGSAVTAILESAGHRCWGVRRRGSHATLAALAQLTSRERDVIELILAGYSMKQISAELGISIQTTAKHRVRILEKFAVKNDVQLLLNVFPVMDAAGQLPKRSND